MPKKSKKNDVHIKRNGYFVKKYGEKRWLLRVVRGKGKLLQPSKEKIACKNMREMDSC